MKNPIATLICLLLLVGCGKHETQKQTPVVTVLTNGQSQIIKIAFTNDPSLANTGIHSKQPLSIVWPMGSDRAALTPVLDQIHATILKETPEFMLVEFQAPNRVVQAELGFVDGKLKRVNLKPK